jgi:hypothetical protein
MLQQQIVELPTTTSNYLPTKSIFRTKSTEEPTFRKCLDLKDCLDSTNKNIQSCPMVPDLAMPFSSSKTNKTVQKSHTKINHARVLAECKMQLNTRGLASKLAVTGKIYSDQIQCTSIP